MKKSVLKAGAAVALLVGTVHAATFDYNAYGGFVDDGSVTGTNANFNSNHNFVNPNYTLDGDPDLVYYGIDWGVPSNGGGQSGLRATPVWGGSIVSDGSLEDFGELTHINFPITSTGGSLQDIKVRWHLDLNDTGSSETFSRTWEFDLYNWETSNSGGVNDCPRAQTTQPQEYNGHFFYGEGPGSSESICDDAHVFGAALDNNYTWATPTAVYSIHISGFYDSDDTLSANGTFWAAENSSTDGYVKFSITQIAPATVTIGNRAWLDLDNDGQQDGGEPGAPGVSVELWEYNATGPDIQVGASTMTDGNGFYQFENVPTYYIGSPAVQIQYYIKFIPTVDPTLYDVSPIGGGGPLASGTDSDINASGVTPVFMVDDNTTDIDAGFTYGSIGDYVWIDKNQNGEQDGDEMGIEGVTVNLYLEDALYDTTVSQPGGLYTFSPLSEGNYTVEFVLPTGYSFGPQDSIGDDTLDSDADETDGMTDNIELLKVPNDENSSHQYIWDAGIFQELNITKEVDSEIAINGDEVVYTITVTNNSERNASDVNVTDGLPGGMTYESHNASQGDYNETTGLWQVGALEANGGSATLTITASVNTEPGTVTNDACVVTEQNSVEICDDANFTVIEGLELGDLVWYDDDNNGIQDQGEDPVEGFTVELLDENGTEMTDINGIGSMETDENGTYRFLVRPGTYIVRFRPDSMPNNYVFTQRNIGGDESVDSDADTTTGESGQITLLREGNTDVDAGIYCTCYDMEESDDGSAMGTISASLMMLMTLIAGLYFIRREEALNQSRR